MPWYNPASWFRDAAMPLPTKVQKKLNSIGERKIAALLPGWGWSGTPTSWAANRHELLNHAKNWPYVAVNHHATMVALQVPQAAIMREGSIVQGTMRKIWYSEKTRNDPWRRDKRLAKYRSKFLKGVQKKSALVNIQHGDELEPLPPDDRIVERLRNPNPLMTAWEFYYRVSSWHDYVGGCYLWAIPSRDEEGVGELWPIQPNWIRPCGGVGTLVKEWELRPMFTTSTLGIGVFTGGWVQASGASMRIPKEQLIQIGNPHPTNLVDFYSALEAGSDWVDQGDAIERSRTARFQNGWFPGVVIQLDPEMEDPDPEGVARLKAAIEDAYSGVTRTGKPVVLLPGMTMLPIGNTPQEMDYVNSEANVRDKQLALFGTSASQVGLGDTASYANMWASRANQYQSRVNPRLSYYGQVLTERFVPLFKRSEKVVIYYNDATPADPAQKLQENNSALEKGWKTINEVRTDYGLEPYPNGGVNPMLPMGNSEVPWVEEISTPSLDPMAMMQAEQDGQGDGGDEPGNNRLPSRLFGDHPGTNGKPRAALGERSDN